jgi:tetratricopeptide (TPR) repeat protein
MKRALAALLLFALTLVGGAFAYQAVDREREYQGLLRQGDAAMQQGQTFGAIEAYSGAIALRPDSMLAHLRRGETYRQRNDFDAAARDFREAADLDPSATRPLDALAEVFYQRQWFSRAAEVYEGRLRLDEQSGDVHYRLALARYRAGNLAGALAAADDALRLSGEFSDAYYLKALCLREQGRLPEAISALDKAVMLSPALVPAREELAEIYAALGRHADEIEQLQVVAALDRAHVERQVAVGLAHARAGHGELAVLTLGSALERMPDQPLIYAALGRVWLSMADTRDDALSKALEALERVSSGSGATSAALTLYGRALARANQLEAAERALQQATTRFPVDPEAFLVYADVSERRNHPAEARSALLDYGALVNAESDFAGRAARIGRLSLRLNEAATAVQWLRRAAASRTADVSLLQSLAEAQLRAGDRPGAALTVAQALERDPANAALLALSQRTR